MQTTGSGDHLRPHVADAVRDCGALITPASPLRAWLAAWQRDGDEQRESGEQEGGGHLSWSWPN
jgi:hypothetical protein